MMIDAYLAAQEPIASWFAGPWRSAADRAAHARRIADGWAGDRAMLAATLSGALGERRAPPAAIAAAERLGQDGVVAVISGQQPAVGGGPLFCLVKAAHSIAIAAELEASGVPAIPVFWCASEDHDLGEAGHADLVARDGRIQRVHGRLPVAGASLRFQPAAAWWDELLRALESLDGGHLGAAWWRERAPDAGEPVGRWFARLLDACFGTAGLVVVEAQDLRTLTLPGAARALDAWPATAIAERAAQLEAAGHPLPLGPLAQPPLFDDGPDGRIALDTDGAWQLLAQDPTRLSAGAGLRPVLQQLALPCAAYCAGPGEIAYHAQLGPIYPALDALPPLLLPRISLSLIPSWFERALAAWGLSAQQLLDEVEPEPEPDMDEDLAGIESALRALEHRIRGADGDRARRLTTGYRRLQRELQRLGASLERGQRRQQGRRPLGELQAWLLPRSGRQERTMSLAQALWEHGPGLAALLIKGATGAEPGRHQLLQLNVN